MIKTVILIGGPSKGTRFRPLSLDVPKPLFPVAGFPMIYHHIEAACRVKDMKEILLIGSFQPIDVLNRFIQSMQNQFKVSIRYLQEFAALGTAGGLYHFRDQIQSGSPDQFFVMNCDVCGDFPLQELIDFHRERDRQPHFTILATEATRQQSPNFGCIVEDKDTGLVQHYVEKPSTFVSATINCGIYVFEPRIFDLIGEAIATRQKDLNFQTDFTSANSEYIRLEEDIFVKVIANQERMYVFHTEKFWSQIKNAGAAIYANRHYLMIYRRTNPDRLTQNTEGQAKIIGDVFIHPSASVHPSAKLGPNVTIGKNVTIQSGVRIRDSMILEGAVLQEHCCILNAIIGWTSTIGPWARVEGTLNDPNPNKPFAKLDLPDLFNSDGRLNPSITVIGSNVTIPREVIVLNTIVLPHKELSNSCKNQIIL